MKAIENLALTAMLLLVAVLGCSTINNSGTTPLQGTWVGREPGVNPDAPRRLIISGNHMEYRGAIDQDWGKGTFTVREDTEPKQLIVSLTECGMTQYVGKTACLLYKIENGTLIAATSEPGNPAPSGFDAPGIRKMVFRKQ